MDRKTREYAGNMGAMIATMREEIRRTGETIDIYRTAIARTKIEPYRDALIAARDALKQRTSIGWAQLASTMPIEQDRNVYRRGSVRVTVWREPVEHAGVALMRWSARVDADGVGTLAVIHGNSAMAYPPTQKAVALAQKRVRVKLLRAGV